MKLYTVVVWNDETPVYPHWSICYQGRSAFITKRLQSAIEFKEWLEANFKATYKVLEMTEYLS